MIPGMGALYSFDKTGLIAVTAPGVFPARVSTGKAGWLARVEPLDPNQPKDREYGCHRTFLKVMGVGNWHVANPGLYELNIGASFRGVPAPQQLPYTRVLFELSTSGPSVLAVAQDRSVHKEIAQALAGFAITAALLVVHAPPEVSPEREAELARENERLLAEADALLEGVKD